MGNFGSSLWFFVCLMAVICSMLHSSLSNPSPSSAQEPAFAGSLSPSPSLPPSLPPSPSLSPSLPPSSSLSPLPPSSQVPMAPSPHLHAPMPAAPATSPLPSSPPATPPAGLETSPASTPVESSAVGHSDLGDDHASEEDPSSKGMSGGKKAGIAFAVILSVGVVGLAAFVYKKRQQNIQRSHFGYTAAT